MSDELRAPREVIGTTLAEISAEDPRLVVLDADLARSTRLDAFEASHPESFYQMGVAEQNSIGVATGMSIAGLRPVFASMAMFSLGLPWTQLRQACYSGASITVIGTHPGLDVGPDGGTHQMFEDLALARVIPEMTVLAPCDGAESAAAIRWSVATGGVNYIRIARQPVPELHDDGSEFVPGAAERLGEGREILLVAAGSMVSVARDVATRLAPTGIGASVVNVRSVKPLDPTIREWAEDSTLVVSVENHSVLGGLGSAVAELLGGGVPLVRIGVPDTMGSSASADELRASMGLDAEGVTRQVLAAWRTVSPAPAG
jgi:transketolase